MFSRHLFRRAGFTLVELMVVIGILAALMAISTPLLLNRLNAMDAVACQSNLKQLSLLGMKYSEDMAHRNLLPTSGMDDDPDTEEYDEGEGWWYSIATMMDEYVIPVGTRNEMEISTLFHCPGDKREVVDSDASLMPGTAKYVSYVSWTDGSEDTDNPNSCIRLNKQRLDELPWISDGNPVPGQSVKNIKDFKEMVLPALERHDEKIVVVYASGVIKAIEIDPEGGSLNDQYKRVAPWMYEKQVEAVRAKRAATKK